MSESPNWGPNAGGSQGVHCAGLMDHPEDSRLSSPDRSDGVTPPMVVNGEGWEVSRRQVSSSGTSHPIVFIR